MTRRSPWFLLCVLALGACGDDGSADASDGGGAGGPAGDVALPPEGEPWDRLSEWNLFADLQAHELDGAVMPFEVISPLFSDFTSKHRFLWLPEGEQIGYDAEGEWDFPVGTVLGKSFAYPLDARDPDAGERVLETRLLVHEPGGWDALVYVYDDDGLEAERKVAGKRIDARWIDDDGQERENRYSVPNTNQCRECHGEGAELNTLGGVTRQLDRDGRGGRGNQLELLVERGWLDAEALEQERPRMVDPFGDGPLDDRYRAYVDANCGHCHNDEEESGDDGSGLWLRWTLTDPQTATPATRGICKMPQSAGGATCGNTFDVVPGAPERSVLMCRLESDDPEVQMPPLGRNLVHDAGLELIAEWISAQEGSCD